MTEAAAMSGHPEGWIFPAVGKSLAVGHKRDKSHRIGCSNSLRWIAGTTFSVLVPTILLRGRFGAQYFDVFKQLDELLHFQKTNMFSRSSDKFSSVSA